MSEPAETPMQARIRDVLADRLDAPDLVLDSVERVAVGWSHETWLLDASWTESGDSHSQGLCLRADPGNALLRDLSDLATQHRVLSCLEPTPVPAPRPCFFEDDPAVLGAPFLVMEKVGGHLSQPVEPGGRRFYEDAAAGVPCPAASPTRWWRCTTLDWRSAGLEFLGVPGPGDDFARREVAKWRGLIEASGIEPDPVLLDLILLARGQRTGHGSPRAGPRRLSHRQPPRSTTTGCRHCWTGRPR